MQTFNEWTILEELGSGKVLCRCSCGTEKINNKYNVISGRSKSCGCISSRLKAVIKNNVENQSFNDWRVDKELGGGKVLCTCSCGVQKICNKNSIISGKSKSCGHSTNGFKNFENKQINEWTILKELGYGFVQCKCSCGTEAILKKSTILNGSSKSCGCKKTQYMMNKLASRYGEVSANKVADPRESWQIQAIQSYDNLSNLMCQIYGEAKPSIKQLSLLLCINEASVGRTLKRLEAYNLVEMYPKSSVKEQEVLKYIKSIYTGDVQSNVRCIVGTYEFDIYIPDKKIAIEFNGNYWHSDVNKDSAYHQRKTIECAKQGIQIIHIFEYEWDNVATRNKLKSYIQSILCENNKIYARDTEVKEISFDEAKVFEEENHLQGSIYSAINIGMYQDNNLIGLMTFDKPRFCNDTEYELIRLCFRQGIEVVGGSNKLFKYFLRKYRPKSIISYCNIAKFKGTVYTNLGFKSNAKLLTKPNYVWFNLSTKEVLSRYKTQKSKLGGSESQTETSIMEDNGFVKIHDCGNLKFIWES